MKQNVRPDELAGLCTTCDHAGSCAYLARTEGPIWSCEEFDDSGQASPGPTMTTRPSLVRRTVEPPRVEPGTLMGLCGNCEKRSFCALPGVREGAWFCEEYR